jgi:hypothetical protein
MRPIRDVDGCMESEDLSLLLQLERAPNTEGDPGASQAPTQGRYPRSDFFYFIENIVTYYIITSGSSTSPVLHEMVEEI